jgi:hypothetical protein
MKIGPKYLRMDNAGENKSLADRMKHKDWKLPIIVEWTARDTPQQNSPVEVGFSTLSGRARAMLQEANVPKKMRKLLMPEAVKTATHLDGLIPVEINGVLKTKYEHHLGVNPPFARALRTWGEAGTVTIKSRTFQPKDKARGVTCLLIGYSPEHPAGTYPMFDPSTKGVHMTRDVTWLRRMFYPPPKLEVGEGIIPTADIMEVPDDFLNGNAAVRDTTDDDVDEEVPTQDDQHYEEVPTQDNQDLEE